ncbi:chondroitin proteoglycan 2-like [Brachionus plicatilis]|uniref:Chondroitin proteoglycan 2-like n=1 Tax=Brachionus plicatilis TaxID=10195 RepID=A0A3M7Q8C3_BRAPC|nr:chondroitin proteoglycan 2-like [Brachionus plicatilis]
MLKTFVLICLTSHLINCKTVYKRQTCDLATDFTRVPGTCNQFYRCFGGYSATVSCDPGFKFSTETKSCRPESEVNCSTRGNECTDDINYAKVTNDCKKFFRCKNGYLSIETCQDGLVYNVQAKACDWPANVPGCEKTYWGNECDSSIDLTRDPKDCTKFRQCDKGYIVTKSCNDNLFFDNNLKVCNWPYEVPECQVNTFGNQCDISKDLTRYPDDCKKYYRCKNGFLSTEICPEGLLFDANLKRCELASRVSCNLAQKSCQYTDDLTQVPNDCSKYYTCRNGVLNIETCPEGYFFDASFKACNLKSLVSTCQPSRQCSSGDNLTQVPGNCNQYFRCINNALQTEYCPNGYFFDSNLRACNIIGQVYTCF